jgi:hypothetical protein
VGLRGGGAWPLAAGGELGWIPAAPRRVFAATGGVGARAASKLLFG